MIDKIKTTLAISLMSLVLTGCQSIKPTRDANWRLTESAIQSIETDRERQPITYTNRERTYAIPLYGWQF